MGWLVAETKTGNVVIRSLLVKAGSVAPKLNKAGTIEAVVPLPLDVVVSGQKISLDPSLFEAGRYSLGLEEGGVILDCGPIWSHSYDLTTRELTLTAAGFRSLFESRYVLPPNVSTFIGADSTFSNLSLRTIAKRVVQQAVAWTDGGLPIVFEADIAGTNTRTYLGEDLQVVDDVLTKLTEVLGGPDIDFRAEFTSDRSQVVWRMVTGDSELKQAGTDWVWDASLPSSPVRAASVTVSAENLSTTVWGSGGTPEGAEVALSAKASSTVLTSAGFPMLEDSVSHNSVTVQDTLDKHVQAALVQGSKHVRQYDFSVSKAPSTVIAGHEVPTAPQLGQYRVGDYGVLGLPEDPYLGAASRQRVRLLEYQFNYGSDVVDFTCAESRSDV